MVSGSKTQHYIFGWTRIDFIRGASVKIIFETDDTDMIYISEMLRKILTSKKLISSRQLQNLKMSYTTLH